MIETLNYDCHDVQNLPVSPHVISLIHQHKLIYEATVQVPVI